MVSRKRAVAGRSSWESGIEKDQVVLAEVLTIFIVTGTGSYYWLWLGRKVGKEKNPLVHPWGLS